MRRKARRSLIAALALLCLTIAACGQTGPLMLPDATTTGEDEESDVENG